jgi:hypothetical protein
MASLGADVFDDAPRPVGLVNNACISRIDPGHGAGAHRALRVSWLAALAFNCGPTGDFQASTSVLERE